METSEAREKPEEERDDRRLLSSERMLMPSQEGKRTQTRLERLVVKEKKRTDEHTCFLEGVRQCHEEALQPPHRLHEHLNHHRLCAAQPRPCVCMCVCVSTSK